MKNARRVSFSAAAVCLRLWVFADDKLCQAMNLTSSHQNPVVRQIYVDLGAAPMDNTMYGLLHTHYFQRSQLSAHH